MKFDRKVARILKQVDKRILISILMVFVFVLAALPPRFSTVVSEDIASEAIYFDRTGVPLQSIRVKDGERSLGWKPLNEISKHLQEFVVSTEDRRFLEHHGVDWLAVMAAVRDHLLLDNRDHRGASTISMQVVKLLGHGELFLKVKSNSDAMEKFVVSSSALHLVALKILISDLFPLIVKIYRMGLALIMETYWSKNQILEAYLNLSTWRGDLRGIHGTSMALFDKSPEYLTIDESAILAALLKFPSKRAERILDRACYVLKKYPSVKADVDCKTRMQDFLPVLQSRRALAFTANRAPHFVNRFHKSLVGESKNQWLSIDGSLQSFVTQALNAQLREIADQNVRDASAVVMNYKTGEILAYVGHVNANGLSSEVDGVQALRQAGSTLKPFLYAMAFDKNFLGAETLIDDSPILLSTSVGGYQPENYDHQFHGPVPVRMALGSSLNIPAVRTIGFVGENNFAQKLKDLGFALPNDGSWYGPSLALGSLDVSLWSLVRAYGVLARNGIGFEPSPVANTLESNSGALFFEEQTASSITEILSNPENRSLSFGTSGVLSTSFRAAVKTGTSKDMRDNWCMGYSDQFVVGVWVGNYDGEGMWNVSGVSGAAPAWAEVMNYLHGAGTKSVTNGDAILESKYINAEVGSHNVLRQSERLTKIKYPTEDLVIALDPDIPEDRERVMIEIDGYSRHYEIALNGKKLPCNQSRCLWQPVKGGHLLAVLDKSGLAIDSVHFEVK